MQGALLRRPSLPSQRRNHYFSRRHRHPQQHQLRVPPPAARRLVLPPGRAAAQQRPGNADGDSSSEDESTKIDASAAASAADLADQWRGLQAAGVGAPPSSSGVGDGSGNSSSTDDAPASIAARLARLARGGPSLLVEGADDATSQAAAASGSAAESPAAAIKAETTVVEETVVEAVVVDMAEASSSAAAAAAAADVWRLREQTISADVDELPNTRENSKNGDGAADDATTTTTDAATGEGDGATYVDVRLLPPALVPVTSMAALAVAAVLAAQWWPVLRDVWWGLTAGGQARETLWQVATTYPDTPATRALRLDLAAIAYDREWWRLATAALAHSGAAPALIAFDGLYNAGKWLELSGGRLQTLAVFAAAAVGAAAGHVVAPTASTCLTGPGLMVGAYTGWATVALLARARGAMPMPVTSDRGLVYCALQAALAANQPAVGLSSIVGGAIGGVVGGLAAPLIARVAFYAVAIPVTGALAAARVTLETVKLVAAIGAAFVVATWRAAAEAVKTIRGL